MYVCTIPEQPATPPNATSPTQTAIALVWYHTALAVLLHTLVMAPRIRDRKGLRVEERFRRKGKKAPQPVYCVVWSKEWLYGKERYPFFAAVGGRFISFYHYEHSTGTRERSGKANLLEYYGDSQRGEELFCCAFAGRSSVKSSLIKKIQNGADKSPLTEIVLDQPKTMQKWPLAGRTGNGENLFCVAGKQKIIKVLDMLQERFVGFLHGHGDEILDLKGCPTDEHLLCSASMDKSFRLWNLRTGTCVAVFAGPPLAHADYVISVDWHHTGQYLLTGSGDTSVKIWYTGPGSTVEKAVRQSHLDADMWRDEKMMRVVDPVAVFTPCFCGDDMHFHPVDW